MAKKKAKKVTAKKSAKQVKLEAKLVALDKKYTVANKEYEKLNAQAKKLQVKIDKAYAKVADLDDKCGKVENDIAMLGGSKVAADDAEEAAAVAGA